MRPVPVKKRGGSHDFRLTLTLRTAALCAAAVAGLIWIAAPAATAQAFALDAAAQVQVVASNEVNEIDLAAGAAPLGR